MNRQNNAVAYVIVIFGLLLFGTACESGRNGYGINPSDYKTPETSLKDTGKKEPQTREEKAERICHQAKELEGLGQVISTELKDSCKSLGYW